MQNTRNEKRQQNRKRYGYAQRSIHTPVPRTDCCKNQNNYLNEQLLQKIVGKGRKLPEVGEPSIARHTLFNGKR